MGHTGAEIHFSQKTSEEEIALEDNFTQEDDIKRIL